MDRSTFNLDILSPQCDRKVCSDTWEPSVSLGFRMKTDFLKVQNWKSRAVNPASQDPGGLNVSILTGRILDPHAQVGLTRD